MKQGYEIKGFEKIAKDKLLPHPDVQLPIELEDATALKSSVDDAGILLPLLVSAKPEKDGRRWIFDGVNRWRSAQGGETLLPCILAEVPDPRSLALTCLGTGRKRSTGQRVMAFLEMHRKEVLDVAALIASNDAHRAARDSRAGQMTGSVIPKKFEDFTAEAISRKLGVSDKDVRLGIELLRAEYMAPEPEKQPFSKQRLALLAGGGSIRRWRAAVGGRKAEQHGRADVDYPELLMRGLQHMATVFPRWKELPPHKRAIAEDYWNRKVKPNLPEVFL